MHVSVIIPALNEGPVILRAIESALRAGADDVLVADGGSDDGTPDIARNAHVRVVAAPRGRALQQNAAAAAAQGDWLLFLHADNWLSEASIRQLQSAGGSDRPCGGFYQAIEASGLAFRWLEKGNAWRVRWRGLAYGDQGIWVRRDLFWAVGGFPPVPLMEDVLLMKRLRRRSWPILLPGPLHVDARRWQRRGVVRQTLTNWCLLVGLHLGVSPARLARYYRRHDEPDPRRVPEGQLTQTPSALDGREP
jgi:rSAM/selenodomain-associated transferase 2